MPYSPSTMRLAFDTRSLGKTNTLPGETRGICSGSCTTRIRSGQRYTNPTHSFKSDEAVVGPRILYNTLEVSTVPLLGSRAGAGSIYDNRIRGLNSQIYAMSGEFSGI